MVVVGGGLERMKMVVVVEYHKRRIKREIRAVRVVSDRVSPATIAGGGGGRGRRVKEGAWRGDESKESGEV